MRLKPKSLMFWKDVKTLLFLPSITSDYLLRKATPKTGEVLEYFMLTSILHERKILEWKTRTIVIEMFPGLPEISHWEVKGVLAAVGHELLLQALSKE